MRKLIPLILALALAPVAASAETPQNSWENLMQLPPGHKIKVFDKSLKSWSGELVSVSHEAITIQENRKQEEITVERANVLRVTDLRASGRGRGALIGLIIGASSGGVFGLSFREDWPRAKQAPVLAAFFGGIGAGIGALKGSHPTIYRAKARRPAPDSNSPAPDSPGPSADE